MDLWIRSQDRNKLVKCNDIVIKTESDDGKSIRGYQIIGYFDKETEYEELGFYLTHYRALKVLDNMQQFLVNINDEEDGNDYYSIYEMPKE